MHFYISRLIVSDHSNASARKQLCTFQHFLNWLLLQLNMFSLAYDSAKSSVVQRHYQKFWRLSAIPVERYKYF